MKKEFKCIPGMLFLLFKVGKDLVHLFIVTAWKQLSKRLSLKCKVGGLNPGSDMHKFDCQTLSNRCKYHRPLVIMIIAEDPLHPHELPSLGAVTICFNDLGLSRPGFEHPTFFCKRGERSNRLPHCHYFIQ